LLFPLPTDVYARDVIAELGLDAVG
jgi:hypothetical protein